MELSKVIAGPVVTEKSERLKTERSYTLKVDPAATKIDLQKALEKFYDVEVASVRVMRVGNKTRAVSPYKTFTKRHAYKKMIVTLTPKSKALDLSQFNA
jgi:ribosomal protein L23